MRSKEKGREIRDEKEKRRRGEKVSDANPGVLCEYEPSFTRQAYSSRTDRGESGERCCTECSREGKRGECGRGGQGSDERPEGVRRGREDIESAQRSSSTALRRGQRLFCVRGSSRRANLSPISTDAAGNIITTTIANNTTHRHANDDGAKQQQHERQVLPPSGTTRAYK